MHILLVEDNPVDAGLVKIFLEDGLHAPFRLEEARRLSEALQKVANGGIDVVLLDLCLPDSNGLATFQQFHAAGKGVPIVVLSGMEQESIALEAVRMGAQDYLVKGKTDSDILARALKFAVERAAQFKKHQADRAGMSRRLHKITENLAKLTARETEILGLIAQGIPLKQIAFSLGTSYNTVRNQRASIMEKMQADSREDLLRMVLIAQFGRDT